MFPKKNLHSEAETMAESRGKFDVILQRLIANEEKLSKPCTKQSGHHGDRPAEKMADTVNGHRRRGGSGRTQKLSWHPNEGCMTRSDSSGQQNSKSCKTPLYKITKKKQPV